MHTKRMKKVGQMHFTPYVGNFVAVNVILWIIRAQNWWHFLGFPPMKPEFADLRAYTAQVTCAQHGINYLVTNCDPWGRKIGQLEIYVPILKFLNLNEARTNIVGNTFQVLLFISIYAAAYALQLDLRKPRNAFLMILILISPPFALLIERGQFEIILFVLIILAAFIIHRNRKIFAYLILGFLSIFKFYPIILLTFLLASRRIRNTKLQLFIGFFVFLVATGTIFYSVWGQIDSMQANSLSAGFWRTFGITVLPYLGVKALNGLHIFNYQFHIDLIQSHSIGMLIFVVAILILFYLRSQGKVFGPNLSALIEEGSLSSIFLLFSLCMVCISYFVVSSYDYRMIYMLPLFLLGLSQDNGERKNRLTIYFAYGIPFVMWCQVFIWTSALAQIPILVSMAMILFNVGPLLLSDYVGGNWAKRLGIFRNK